MKNELTDEESTRAEAFFNALLVLCQEANLHPTLMNAVLAKVLVIMSLDECDKEQFMRRLNYVYEFESFMKPDHTEIH